MYNNTWVSLEGCVGVLATGKGSGAGVPLADLCFILAMSVILKKLRGELSSRECLHYWPWQHATKYDGMGEGLFLHDVSYSDDVAVPVFAPAAQVSEKLACAAACCVQVFALYGLDVNFSPGKSEAIIRWIGPGSAQAKRDLMIRGQGVVNFNALGKDFCLRVVLQYKHMGPLLTANSHVGQEIVSRLNSMFTHMPAFVRQVLKNPSASFRTKLLLVQSHLFSKGFFHSGVWPKLSSRNLTKLHHAVMLIYRRIAGAPFDIEHILTDDDVIAEFGVLHPTVMIRWSRLLFFGRLVTKAPPFMFAIMEECCAQSTSWINALRNDLAWLTCGPSFKSSCD
eukprot:9677735-Karenia_brevis.AAC.1